MEYLISEAIQFLTLLQVTSPSAGPTLHRYPPRLPTYFAEPTFSCICCYSIDQMEEDDTKKQKQRKDKQKKPNVEAGPVLSQHTNVFSQLSANYLQTKTNKS